MTKTQEKRNPQEIAAELGNLTFQLLAGCQEKEARIAAQFGLTSSEFRTLRVFQRERTMHVKSLVERVGLSGSRLTRILDGLERKGFMKRSIDPLDRRGIIVTLTDKGAAISQRLDARFVQIHEEILADIPEEIHEPLVQSLAKMLTSINQWLRKS